MCWPSSPCLGGDDMDLEAYLSAGAKGGLLPWSVQLSAARNFDLPLSVVEERAILAGLLPARYQRNRESISINEQFILCRSRVAIIGCGGLGGYLIEELARLGVGTLVGVDPDVFEEHNLNRQLLSQIDALGEPKVQCASRRVMAINPAVRFEARPERLGPENGLALLEGCQVAVDALDGVSSRRALKDACAAIGIPMVHGAIAGWYGQIATEFPGDGILEALYAHATEEKGSEKQLGNPSFTPAVIASLEAAEVCKLLLGKGQALRHMMLAVNLLDMSFERIKL